jgi:hypothetical protein
MWPGLALASSESGPIASDGSLLSLSLPRSSVVAVDLHRRATVTSIGLQFDGNYAAAEVTDASHHLRLWVTASHKPDLMFGSTGFQQLSRPGAGTYTLAHPVALRPGVYQVTVLCDKAVSLTLGGHGSRPVVSSPRARTPNAAMARSDDGSQGPLRIARADFALPRHYHLVVQIADFNRVNDEAGYESMCVASRGQYCESPPHSTVGTWWTTPDAIGGSDGESVGTYYKAGDFPPGQYTALAELAAAATQSSAASLVIVL